VAGAEEDPAMAAQHGRSNGSEALFAVARSIAKIAPVIAAPYTKFQLAPLPKSTEQAWEHQFR